MIFLSPHKNLRVQVIGRRTALANDGTREVLEPAFFAEFRYQVLTPELESVARAHLKFRGTNLHPDGHREVDPVLQRVSTYDTGWAPAPIRERVEKALLESPDLGQLYVRADDKVPVPEPPWPRYDELTTENHRGRSREQIAEMIADRAAEFGVDFPRVIAYERANRNRPEVVAALEKRAEDVVEVAA